MEAFLLLLGIIFSMFLVLAAATEVVMEIFRGALERIGLTWVRGKVTLDEALALVSEFAPKNADLNAKLEAVKTTAQQLTSKSAEKIKELEDIRESLKSAGANTDVLAGKLNAIAINVKNDLEQDEHRRIFWLRLIAAIIGCFLTYETNFYVFHVLSQIPECKEFFTGLSRLDQGWINILVGGFAAAAGSSYWHDQLDKIRNLKNAAAQTKKLVS
jgi:hypothetical protein